MCDFGLERSGNNAKCDEINATVVLFYVFKMSGKIIFWSVKSQGTMLEVQK